VTQFVWADGRHTKDIFALWKQGFPEDTEEDIRTFLNTLRQDARCFMLIQENEARSMAFVIPSVLVQNGQKTVWYVYAAATATQHRGKGLFARLLEELAHRAEEAGVYGLFLRPATPSLFGYYERLGFKTAFWVEEIKCKAKELHKGTEKVTWQTVTSHHAVCRQYWLSVCGVPHILWSDRATDYAVKLLENGGMLASAKGAVMYHREGNRLIVTELLCRQQDKEAVMSSLTRQFPCREIRIMTSSFNGENRQPFGMFRATCPLAVEDDGWYMGFSLE